MAKRNLYLKTIPVDQAVDTYLAAVKELNRPLPEKLVARMTAHQAERNRNR